MLPDGRAAAQLGDALHLAVAGEPPGQLDRGLGEQGEGPLEPVQSEASIITSSSSLKCQALPLK